MDLIQCCDHHLRTVWDRKENTDEDVKRNFSLLLSSSSLLRIPKRLLLFFFFSSSSRFFFCRPEKVVTHFPSASSGSLLFPFFFSFCPPRPLLPFSRSQLPSRRYPTNAFLPKSGHFFSSSPSFTATTNAVDGKSYYGRLRPLLVWQEREEDVALLLTLVPIGQIVLSFSRSFFSCLSMNAHALASILLAECKDRAISVLS